MNTLHYSLKPDTRRVLTGQLLLLLFLCIFVYAAVFLNLFLLEVEFTLFIHFIVVVIIAVLIGLQLFLTYKKNSKITYYIYEDRIVKHSDDEQYIMYISISRLNQKTNLLDKIFKTATIILEPGFKIISVKKYQETYSYLQRIVQYHRTNQ